MSIAHMRMRIPEPHDVDEDHWEEPLAGLGIQLEGDLEQSKGMRDEEEQDCY